MEEDTEWTDALRKHGILPPKPPSEQEIAYRVWDAAVDAQREQSKDPDYRLKDLDLEGLDELEDEEDERVLQAYRQRRIEEMLKEAALNKYGRVETISEPDFVKEVTEASNQVNVVVHLYKSYIEECKTLDAVLEQKARAYPMVKFVRIQSDQAIRNYPDRLVPTLLFYQQGDLKNQLVGGERKMISPQLSTCMKQVEMALSSFKVIPSNEDEEEQ